MEIDMMMARRFAEIRLNLEGKITQEKFAEGLKIKRSTVSNLESGKKSLSGRNIKTVCEVYNVNEEWLRYGIGEMFNSPPALDDEAKYTEQAKRLLKYHEQLSPKAQDMLIEYAEKILADEKALRGNVPEKGEKSG